MKKAALRLIVRRLSVEAAGIEPCDKIATSYYDTNGCEFCGECGAALALHFGGSDRHAVTEIDMDLQRVINTWNRLPKLIRNAIKALALSQEGSEQ